MEADELGRRIDGRSVHSERPAREAETEACLLRPWALSRPAGGEAAPAREGQGPFVHDEAGRPNERLPEAELAGMPKLITLAEEATTLCFDRDEPQADRPPAPRKSESELDAGISSSHSFGNDGPLGFLLSVTKC